MVKTPRNRAEHGGYDLLAAVSRGRFHEVYEQDLATAGFSPIRGAAFGPLEQIDRPPPPALGHLRNRTLGDVLAAVHGNRTVACGSADAVHGKSATGLVAAPESPAHTENRVAAPAVDLQGIVLGVVAEKTGYPVELLGLDMDMESGLGIDSIKRVEILSALEKQVPAMGAIDLAQMFALRTLGDVLQLIDHNPVTVETPAESPGSEKAEDFPPDDSCGRFLVKLEEEAASGFTLAGLRDCNPLTIVTGEASGEVEADIARALARLLGKRGVAAKVSGEVPPGVRGIVYLEGLRRVDNIEDAIAINREAFQAARTFSAGGVGGGVFVTVQDTGGDFGLGGAPGVRAWLGGLSGLAKTAALEWPEVSCKAIDVECGGRSPEEIAAAIEHELMNGGPQVEVALGADGSRRVVRCLAAPLPAGDKKPSVEEGAVVIVSGGARGVTAAALQGIAAAKPSLVLLGRTSLAAEPACCRGIADEAGLNAAVLQEARTAGRNVALADVRRQVQQVLARREIEANLAALRSAGARVRYLSVDVEDAPALSAALDAVRREWGPIQGIVHGAGVLADKRITDKTPEQFDRVFAAKVTGLRNLLAATRDDPLLLITLFSSMAARCGNVGQCDYAMANEVLNKVAAAEQRRRGPSCRVKSLNWGAWDGGMVTPSLKAHFQALGIPLIPLAVGARWFAAETAADIGGVEVVLGCDPGAGLTPHGPRVTRMDVLIDSLTYPFLHSHCVEGDVPVLPAVLALEWFVRAARLACPDRVVACCRDLKVLAGALLPDLDRGRWFRVLCRELRKGEEVYLEVELYSRGVRHYTAVVEMATGQREPDAAGRGPLERGRDWPWTAAEAYDGPLFHGPDFQVLRSLEDLSAHGGSATLWGTEDVSWGAGPWWTNPAALDGGLQLILLWALHHKGRKSLPTHVGTFIPYREQPSTAPLRCELHVKESTRHEVVAHLLFLEPNGRPAAELRDVSMTLLQPAKDKVVA
jgi:NAD(P)-dependent dehydrogenase (short-subunit alcohol dehydrogenase family)